jgi:hypothetical protein
MSRLSRHPRAAGAVDLSSAPAADRAALRDPGAGHPGQLDRPDARARGARRRFQTQLGISRLSRDSRLVFLPLDNAGSPVWSDLGIYVRAERTLPAYTESFLQELVRELGERERRENAAHPQIA